MVHPVSEEFLDIVTTGPMTGTLKPPEIHMPGALEFVEGVNSYDAIVAGYKRESLSAALGTAMAGMDFTTQWEEMRRQYALNYEDDPNYDARADERRWLLPEHVRPMFDEARSTTEANLMWSMLMRAKKKEDLIMGSGLPSSAGMFIAWLINDAPTFGFRPIGAGILAGGIQIGTETLLHRDQPFRHPIESVMNVSSQVVGGAVLSAVAHAFTGLRVMRTPGRALHMARLLDENVNDMRAAARQAIAGEFDHLRDPDPISGRAAPMIERAREAVAQGIDFLSEVTRIKLMLGQEHADIFAREFTRVRARAGIGVAVDAAGEVAERIRKPLTNEEFDLIGSFINVNSREGMHAAIKMMVEGGGITADHGASIARMVNAMPNNFFADLSVQAGKSHPRARGVYRYFDDAILLFGRNLDQSGLGVAQAGKTFAHEMGHRLFFTMTSESELKMARKIFDNTFLKGSTKKSLKPYNENDHFSEWWAFEFADYWVRRTNEGEASALSFLERTYIKEALGMANAFESMLVQLNELVRIVLKTRDPAIRSSDVTQATNEMMDVFFDSITSRIKGKKKIDLESMVKNTGWVRAVRFKGKGDFLSGTQGKANTSDDAFFLAVRGEEQYSPNFSGSAYEINTPQQKPFARDFNGNDDGDMLMPAAWVEKLVEAGSPVGRLLSSSNAFARHVTSYLVEHPFYQRKNKINGTTPHGVDRNVAVEWLAPMVKAMEQTDKLYTKYRERYFNESKRTDIARGRSSTVMQLGEDLVKGRGGAMTKQEFLREVGRAKIRTVGDDSVDLLPEAVEAAQVWSEKLFRRAGETAQELQVFSIKERRRVAVLREKMSVLMSSTENRGMTVKQARYADSLKAQIDELEAKISKTDHFDLDPNYLPRLWNTTAIRANRDGLMRILMKEGGYSEIDAAAKIQEILEGKSFIPIDDDLTGMARSLKERTVDVDNIYLEEFIEMNIASVGRYYATRMGADIELSRQFGSIDMLEVTNRIRAEYDVRILKLDPTYEQRMVELDNTLVPEGTKILEGHKMKPKAEKLLKERDQVLEDLHAIRDRIRGTYGIPEDPTTWTHRGIRVAKMWNAVSLLTGHLAALADLGKLVMADGTMRTMRPMLEAYKSDLGLLKTMRMAKDEANLAGEAFDMYLSMRSALFADLADSLSSATPFERAAGNATQQFFNISGMNQWNEMVKTMASLTVGSRIILESENLLRSMPSNAPLRSALKRNAASINEALEALQAEVKVTDDFFAVGGGQTVRKSVTGIQADNLSVLKELSDLAKRLNRVEADSLSDTDLLRNFGRMETSVERILDRLVNEGAGVSDDLLHQFSEILESILKARKDSLGTGKISDVESIKLHNLDINTDVARIIVEQSEKHGLQGEYVRIAKTEKWDNTPEVRAAAAIYTRALGKDINRVIVTPGKGELPLFMSQPLATLIFQFKSFAIAATHRTMVPGLQLKDANFIQGNIALIGLGAMVEAIRRYQLDNNQEQGFGDWLISAIERGGNIGALSDLNQILETLSNHSMGLRPILGDAQPYNSSNMRKLGAVGGPVVQQASNLAHVIWDIGPGDADSRTADAFTRLLYGSRIYYANGLFNYVEEGAAFIIGK